MTVKIGVNGFGRIGRNFLRAAKQRGVDLDMVAVNDITDAATLAHLLKYDSVLGTYPGDVHVSDNGITVDGDELRVLAERDPANLPWKDPRRGDRDRVHGVVHEPREGRDAPRGGRSEGPDQRAGQG